MVTIFLIGMVYKSLCTQHEITIISKTAERIRFKDENGVVYLRKLRKGLHKEFVILDRSSSVIFLAS